MNGKLLEVSVVARRLTVSVDTVRRMLKDENSPLKGVRIGKKSYRVWEESVENLLKSRETN